jgi:putative restriction endonuclease
MSPSEQTVTTLRIQSRALTDAPAVPSSRGGEQVAVLPRARRFTVDEFERMVHAGVFASDDRLELIEGEIIETAPIGPRHGSVVDRLNALMSRRLAARAIVRVQGSVGLAPLHSRPQPDVALLRPRPDYYATRAPGARVRRGPSADSYREVRAYRRGERLPLRAFPDVSVAVDDVLG